MTEHPLFTQADVDFLKGMRADYAAILARSMGLHAQRSPAILMALDSITSRIASLLPPQPARTNP